MAKKCKDCDPNKYIEGVAYRGKNGYSFDGIYNYNDVGQPYDSNGNPTTDMLANVSDMLDAYNPIFTSRSDSTGLPTSLNNPILIKGIDKDRGFWFIWSFVDGMVAYNTPRASLTPPAITSVSTAIARINEPFAFPVTTDQIPSALNYTDFGKFSDSDSVDKLRFSSYFIDQNYTQVNEDVTITTNTSIFKLDDTIFCKFKTGGQTKSGTYKIIQATATTIKIQIPGYLAASGTVDLYSFNYSAPNGLTNYFIKNKSNYVGYYTGLILATVVGTTASYTSKKSLTIKSLDSEGRDPIFVTSLPTATAFRGNFFFYQFTTNHSQSSFDVTMSSNQLFMLNGLGLNWDPNTKILSGTITPQIDTTIKTETWTFEIRSKKDADAGNKVTFNLNVVKGNLDPAQSLPTITLSSNLTGTVGKSFDSTISTSKGKIMGISNLPEGLTFNSSNARITGTPKHAGTYSSFVSVSNERGTSSGLVTFNFGFYEENNQPSGGTYPSEIKILQNNYSTLKNNRITMRLRSATTFRNVFGTFNAGANSAVYFKKINKSEYTYIKQNNIPQPFNATYSYNPNDRYVTLILNGAHNYIINTYLDITFNTGSLTGGSYRIHGIPNNTSVIIDLVSKTSATATAGGTASVSSYISAPNGETIGDIKFTPRESLEAETNFWIYVVDLNTQDNYPVNIEGSYDIAPVLLAQIDGSGNSCYAPENSTTKGAVSTPFTQEIAVTASSCVKSAWSPNPEENVPSISFNPGPNLEHQIVFIEGPLGTQTAPGYSVVTVTKNNTSTQYYPGPTYTNIIENGSTFANQTLPKSGLKKYPNGIPASNGIYTFFVRVVDTCAFNRVTTPFALFLGTYTPRAGDVYNCLYTGTRRIGSGKGSRIQRYSYWQATSLTSSSIPGNCTGGIISRIGDSVSYNNYAYQYKNSLSESKDIGITSLTNISLLDILGEGPIEGIVDYEIKPRPGYQKGDIGYKNGVDIVKYPGQNSFIRSIYWNETALADDTYPNPGSVNFDFIKLKYDNADSSPRHANLNELKNINLEEEFYSRKAGNGIYVNYLEIKDQNGNVLTNAAKLPRRLTSTKTVGTKLFGKRKFQDGTERSYKKSINILTKDLYGLKLHIKVISLFKQIVDLRIFDSASEAESNSEGGRIDRQSVTFNITLKRIDKGSGSEGLVTTPVTVGSGGKTSLPLVITGRLNSGPYIETFEWTGLNTISNEKTIGWEIEIEPTYLEPIDNNVVLKTGIDSVTEVYNELLALPHTAGIITTFDARFFTSIPQRAYDTRLLKVKVPTNYNPWSRTYDGIWNGSFKLAWTDNPAWCFYDILTNRRYGLGKYVDPRYTDKWTLYEIGKYCDELVSDGKGGLEPRFTCNILIGTREDAYKVVNDMASIFRGLVYYNAGLIMTSQDRPKDPIYIFNNSNVKDGEFTYSNTSKRVRRNIALVRYNDKDNFFKPAVKYVENRDGIIKFGIRETEVSAFGCTSEGQAERLGKWTLLSENSESELISFETSLPAMYLKPGDIIFVQDQNRQNKILGGRTYELNKNYAILDVKYEDISGYLPVISGCKFNVLTPAGNIELGTPTGNYLTDLQESQRVNVFKGRVINNIEFMTTEGLQSGINTSLIRRKQIQTINYNIDNSPDSTNNFGIYATLETGINYYGYTKLDFGGTKLDDKEHTLLQNTVWTIELDPEKYDYAKSPSVSGKSSTDIYPGASLEPYIDKTQKFRVLDIEEQEEYRYKITALQYDETKYELGDDI